MSRGSGTGLLVFGVVLGVIGAIMRFAVKVHTSGFNIHMAGVILLIVGIGLAVVGVLLVAIGGRSRSMTQESVQATPTGEVRTEERTDTGFGP
jgi:membrane-bound ClpP family serine protease